MACFLSAIGPCLGESGFSGQGEVNSGRCLESCEPFLAWRKPCVGLQSGCLTSRRFSKAAGRSNGEILRLGRDMISCLCWLQLDQPGKQQASSLDNTALICRLAFFPEHCPLCGIIPGMALTWLVDLTLLLWVNWSHFIGRWLFSISCHCLELGYCCWAPGYFVCGSGGQGNYTVQSVWAFGVCG